ncbi:MAG: SAM-dependent methyltransferase [Actinomycetota bacterium]|nr:SAM-dependent methyltransferase [Actinomycetota bacterium]
MRGVVSFVGAGPGAADLVTLRGARRIAEADLVLYAQNAIDPAWLRENTKVEATLVDYSRIQHDEVVTHYRTLASTRQHAVHIVAGDPALVTDVREHRELCGKLGIDVDIVPGVTPVSAAAAAAGVTLIESGGADTVILACAEADFDRVRVVAGQGTVTVQAPGARAAELVEALTAAGVGEDVPVTVAYKVSWPDEVLLRTTVGGLVAAVKTANLWRHAFFLIGDAVRDGKPRPDYAATLDRETPAARWTSRTRVSTRDSDGTRRAWPRRKAAAAVPSETVSSERAPEPAPDSVSVEVAGEPQVVTPDPGISGDQAPVARKQVPASPEQATGSGDQLSSTRDQAVLAVTKTASKVTPKKSSRSTRGNARRTPKKA